MTACLQSIGQFYKHLMSGCGCGNNLNKQQILKKIVGMEKTKTVNKKSAFLLKTYEILQNSEYEDIVGWHNDGIGFVIRSIDKFTECILPAYFKHSNFASFIRQLNMYGFSKKRSTKNENYYHHSKFQKNHKDAIRQIQRKIEKKTVRNAGMGPQHTEEPRICSELSIQLQHKWSPAPKPCPEAQADTGEAELEMRLECLQTANKQLIDLQCSTSVEILRDLQSMRGGLIKQQHKGHVQRVLHEYLQAHYNFHSRLGQKHAQKRQGRQAQKDFRKVKSIVLLSTQETLKEKRDNDRS